MSWRRWTPSRLAALILVLLVDVGIGFGVYQYLGAHRSNLAAVAKRPEDLGNRGKDGPINHLPGTLYLVQDGTLYRLQKGTFTPLLRPPGSRSQWTQPTIAPSGRGLIVVRHDYASSDLYLVDSAGQQQQLTHNENRTMELNHWAFYPRIGADPNTLFFSYDPKDRLNSYNVVLAVYSMPIGGTIAQARKWTSPEHYTGGDVGPLPLPSGGVVYTKYSYVEVNSKIQSQIWLTSRAGTTGRPLTAPEDDCSQPSLSPDGGRMLMICTGAKQVATIEIAAFNGSDLGPRRAVVAGQLAAQPTWAPDGSGFVYVAPEGISGHFQLWWQQVPQLALPPPAPAATPAASRGLRTPRTPTPSPPPSPPPAIQASTPPLPPPLMLTADLDFDATSTIAWS